MSPDAIGAGQGFEQPLRMSFVKRHKRRWHDQSRTYEKQRLSQTSIAERGALVRRRGLDPWTQLVRTLPAEVRNDRERPIVALRFSRSPQPTFSASPVHERLGRRDLTSGPAAYTIIDALVDNRS